MQTLKTAIVVVLLLVVFYGVYEMLNRPPADPPPAVAEIDPMATGDLDIDLGEFSSDDVSSDVAVSTGAPAARADGSGGAVVPPPPRSSFVLPPTSSNVPSAAAPQPSAGSFTPPPTPDAPAGANTASSVPRPAVPAPPLLGPPTSTSLPPAPAATSAAQAGSTPAPASDAASTAAVPPPPSGVPLADGEVMAVPGGGPQLQHNPFVNEEVVPKPKVGRAKDQQIGELAYKNALKTARSLIAKQKYREALGKLSVFYKSQDLTPAQQTELLDLLDPLAGRVIYSREHLVERPYVVRRNETLMDIARQYDVPYQLLQKINGIQNPSVLVPGTELKVVSGPFRAEVDLQAKELTLFLDQLYAGRFPITLGKDPEPLEGEFEVRDKRSDKTYFSLDGRTIPADSPANPFGGIWLDLGREICIHGSPMSGNEQQRGCISLSPRDAHDIYGILSVGSKVRILR